MDITKIKKVNTLNSIGTVSISSSAPAPVPNQDKNFSSPNSLGDIQVILQSKAGITTTREKVFNNEANS